jgi:hypothetical protein
MFSRDVAAAFNGPIYPTNSPFGYALANVEPPTTNNIFDQIAYPTNSLPLTGGYGYLFANGAASNNYSAYDNLAYLTFHSSNISFTLFGYSQGVLIFTPFEPGGVGKVDKAEIIGAGTFSLNLTTNFFFRTNGYPNVVTSVVPAVIYTGLAHGTVVAPTPYYRLNFGPPEGP